MNIFKLALQELNREGKIKIDEVTGRLIYSKSDLLDKMISIKTWIDKHGQKTASDIMNGKKVYNYNNIIKTY